MRGKFEGTKDFFLQKIRTFALTSTNLVQHSSPANQTSGNLFTMGDYAKNAFITNWTAFLNIESYFGIDVGPMFSDFGIFSRHHYGKRLTK